VLIIKGNQGLLYKKNLFREKHRTESSYLDYRSNLSVIFL